MTNIEFEGSNGKKETVLDSCELIKVKDVPDAYMTQLARFGKFDIDCSKEQIRVFFKKGVGKGESSYIYRVFARSCGEIIVEKNNGIELYGLDELGNVIIDAKGVTVDIKFCVWLWKKIFDTGCEIWRQ